MYTLGLDLTESQRHSYTTKVTVEGVVLMVCCMVTGSQQGLKYFLLKSLGMIFLNTLMKCLASFLAAMS